MKWITIEIDGTGCITGSIDNIETIKINDKGQLLIINANRSSYLFRTQGIKD